MINKIGYNRLDYNMSSPYPLLRCVIQDSDSESADRDRTRCQCGSCLLHTPHAVKSSYWIRICHDNDFGQAQLSELHCSLLFVRSLCASV